MTPEEVEQEARRIAQGFSFLRTAEILLRTPATLTMRFEITDHSFVQLYCNTRKSLFSYALVMTGARVFGRDCDGGQWHRHPVESPDMHDATAEGKRAVTFEEFLQEVQQVLARLKML